VHGLGPQDIAVPVPIGRDFQVQAAVFMRKSAHQGRTTLMGIPAYTTKINNPTMNGGVCCFGKVIFGGYIPFLTP